MENGHINSTGSEEAVDQDQHEPTVVIVLFLILMAVLPMLLIGFLLGLSYFIIINAALEPYSLLTPSGGYSNYFVLAIWIFIGAILIPLLCLLTPPVSAFLFNLAKPLMINWLRAAFSSAFFLLTFLFSFLVLALLTNLSQFMAYVSGNYGLIIGVGALIGVCMSMSLGLCGRLGAYLRTKRMLG